MIDLAYLIGLDRRLLIGRWVSAAKQNVAPHAHSRLRHFVFFPNMTFVGQQAVSVVGARYTERRRNIFVQHSNTAFLARTNLKAPRVVSSCIPVGGNAYTTNKTTNRSPLAASRLNVVCIGIARALVDYWSAVCITAKPLSVRVPDSSPATSPCPPDKFLA